MAAELDTLVPAHKGEASTSRSLVKRHSRLQEPHAQVLGAGATSDDADVDVEADFGQDRPRAGGPPRGQSFRGDMDAASSTVLHSLGARWTRLVAWATHGITPEGLKEPSKWVNRQLNLPGTVALMLPLGASPWPEGGDEPPRRFQERCCSNITFRGRPHRIWILELSDVLPTEEESFQLHSLAMIVQHATSAARPTSGPWVWPLHNNTASAAILTAYMACVHRLSWWRQMLWAFRVLPPAGGAETERQLAKHYGAAVAYVFAWSNLYIRGLWALVAILMVAWVLDARPDQAFTRQGFIWNFVQLCTVVWAVFMAKEGHSQRRVLSIGGFDDLAYALSQRKLQRRRYRDAMAKSPMQALLREVPAAGIAGPLPSDLHSEAGSLDSRQHSDLKSICTEATAGDASVPGDVSVPSAESAAFVGPPHGDGGSRGRGAQGQHQGPESCWSAPMALWGHCWHTLLPIWGETLSPRRRPSDRARLTRLRTAVLPDAQTLAATRVQAWVRGHQARTAFRSRLLHRARLAAHVGCALDVLRSRNWSYHRPLDKWEHFGQMLVFVFYAVFTVVSFTFICMSVLLAFVQLNIYLTFIWGRCLEPDIQRQAALAGEMCRDPQFVHGFHGWLAEVSSDVSLAILFDVALAEVAKVIARFVIRLRNYEWLHEVQHATVMLSMFIEALSKVGMFTIIGLVFLPQWHSLDVTDNPVVTCQTLPDYRICLAFRGCDTSLEPQCCTGSLLCIAQRLRYDQRRVMFERAMKGPFMVAPFIRILVTVIIPWIAGKLGRFVQQDARSGEVSQRRRWRITWRWKWIIAPICRICALIFYLEPDHVGGLGYIYRGWPFGSVSAVDVARPTDEAGKRDDSAAALRGALDQASRKVFEPIDEVMELKMNFLFVSFFAPIMPLGVIPTLLARLVEVRSKATKLFFVRRRCWPGESRLLHETQDAFAQMAAHVAIVWHVGLVFVAYNPKVALWPPWQVLASWVVATLFVTLFAHYASRYLHRFRRRLCRRLFRGSAS